MRDGPEIELKFLFAERDLAKVKALVVAAAGARQAIHQRLRTIYFDTPNQDLWNQGFTLRVQAIGESHVQTVKRIASSRIERDEWEAQTDRPELDLGSIKNTPLAGLAGKASIRRTMRPAFEAEVERTSFMLETGTGLIEASIDQGAIEANGEKLGVNELELELKSGDRSALFNLARAFVSQAPLHPSLISKAERGHLLAGSLGPRGEKFKAAPCQENDVPAGVPGNLSDLSPRLSFESPGFGEVRQCRGNSPRTHRDETPSCGHDAL